MLGTFEVVADDLGYGELAVDLGVTPYEAVIIASMVEREARIDDDRGPIARVIYNRLAIEQILEIDATVAYATGNNVLTAVDLESDSPYNTRLFGGLPPTPISAPGRASLEAAATPIEGTWRWYVRTEADGGHSFSDSEDRFLADKAVCIERGYCE
jgi:UPF0755 protein